ncbi:LysM peptidoglycan-binding domain-containing protein [Bacteroides muris (ex Fokt et al. 2023)]|uniref:LysM peptidoglycan-binding domain-containing protein n=1 Tax=Bacteroides muris (ex Fokt et al. 2023) TaxID=2937417 RepID=A0A9X2NSY4_9BACE|nr:LysM peptidoglycan-binding domain-containing protein [Bacteroides muris (ex Fokt et al. 2023)]MCR6505090.1 LysM peptidoglycan-binding domain-containing protein [Bacteroides muris (ex Fokt et al. 2023)]
MKTINRIICSLLLAGAYSINAVAQENQSYFLHTIEKGQSLYSIASMYGVSQSDIIKLNPGSDEKIFIGRTLRIPRNAANVQKETYHTIEAGETLYRLTVKYNVSARAICDANPGLSAENFRIGQVIRIPSTTEAKTIVPVETQNNTMVANNIPGPIESRCRDMHKVKRKETVFSISREYGISENELIAANPELKGENKIKKGTFLCIPYPKAQTEQSTQSQAIPTDSELFRENRKETERFSTIKAAVILPFLDGVSKSESSRMVEYYEGLLMAVDSLKRTGTSIDLYTYNSGPEKTSLNSILGKSEMKDMDIIFGPLYQQHIKPLAEFAKKQNTRLVIPFTSKDNTVFQNPAIYQINTPQSYLYSEVYNHFVRQFPNANVIFIEASQDTKDKAEFIKGLKDELRNRSIPMKSLKESVTVESLKTVLRADRENIFIPTSGSNLTLIKILPQLTLLVREQPESRIHLFGYPEWQTYTKDHLEAFFELDTYFYSSFYTNNLLPAAINFTKTYRRWYGKEMDERYPKFGMLGFDTGYFFLKGLARYGSSFEKNMQGLDLVPIQTGFKFQRVNNWGGFINKKVFFVHFTKNFELVKLDFD